jgi:hypothetical protein
MKLSFRTALLVAAALLITFGAVGDTFVVLPDLHGDLIEIGVRPTVLGGTVIRLYFGALAMFGFAVIVSAAAIQSIRGVAPARLPLAVIALIYTIFGVIAFLRSHNPHHLGLLLIGALLAAALANPRPRIADREAYSDVDSD